MVNYNIYFTDIFEVDEDVLHKYGAMNISIVNDLPLFIDPFLLFNSEKDEYKKLHNDILRYLEFLRDETTEIIPKGKLKAWYTFSEVSQNWLGFSLSGNKGKGLGKDFAIELHNNLNKIFNDFGKEKVTQSSHIEKLCVISDKVGRDKISDFTTNLIKNYLLSYTEKFARDYINPQYCDEIKVSKAFFNYNTKSWASKNYYLPIWDGDYIILTPKDMLTRDDTFINKTDMSYQYEYIIPAIENEALRFNLNAYISQMLYDPNRKKGKEPTEKEKKEAFLKTIKSYPEIIDYYIKYKEDNKEEATANSSLAVKEIQTLFIEQVSFLIEQLGLKTGFYEVKGETTSFKAAYERIIYLKDIIENHDGYRIFYINGKPIKRESDLQIMYKLIWFASPFSADSEVNNGRGPVDFKISFGAQNATLVEFKLASNSKLKQNLAKQVEVYKAANNNSNSIKVILFFSDSEQKKVERILEDLKMNKDNIVLIDARDNKSSASNVTV